MWTEYQHWADEDLPEALIELRMDKTDERFRHVYLMVGLRAETCTDLLGCVNNNADLVHCWVKLWGAKNNVK